ncbi:hypothetical protein MCUN1_002861 [Malassezia cuniculi]|uniref:3-oxo-5-alpha-steroid 4-dehydrogenase C-terminal domain-containing protein n=1 Tax=Malassezia cuniculi TaxID=948313 RepID=A0AAF0EVU2_9BASI|nr:hypothetical protein MCUN1_002861 [Malassezia cuniculi]
MYDALIVAFQAAALAVLPVLFVFDAPFGKFAVDSRLNLNGAYVLTGNAAWMAMEVVAPIAAVTSAASNGGVTSLCFSAKLVLALFVLHYVHRALVQPVRNPARSPLHASVVTSGVIFNLINGYLQGTWISRAKLHAIEPNVRVACVGVALFIVGAFGNIWHDEVLRRLRIGAPPRTYAVPHGGLFALPPVLFIVLESELRYAGNQQLEHLHSKYPGTIHPDVTRYEWATHQQRDTAALIMASNPLMSLVAISDGECKARSKFEMVERMLQPCGPPPPRNDD